MKYALQCGVFFALSLFLPTLGRGSVIVGGDAEEVSPADPSMWTSSTSGTVGLTSGKTGTVTVNGGSDVFSGYAYLAKGSSNATGRVTVTGVGSTWTNAEYMYVGYSGYSELNVLAGGNVSTKSCSVSRGTVAGRTGTITVSGAGSQLSTSDYFRLGMSKGTAFLNVLDGGKVTSNGNDTIMGYQSGSSGTVLISGANSTWTNGGDLYVGIDGAGSLTVENGGTLTTKTLWSGAADLHGNGVMNVKGLVADMDVTFDRASGAGKTLSFGTGGTLNLLLDGTGSLGAGYGDSGTLTVCDGVSITSYSGCLGSKAGATGVAFVRGAGSAWTNQDDLHVGESGTGNLTVSDGGRITSDDCHLGMNAGANGTLTVGTGASAEMNHLYIGDSGTGAMTISGGGTVSVYWAQLATNSGSSGTVRVTGAASTLTVEDRLFVSDGASMTVESGGTVNVQSLCCTANSLHGNGTINAHAIMSDISLVFDRTHGLKQSIPFGDGGALNLEIDGTGWMGLGRGGSASMLVTDGVQVSSGHGAIGMTAGATGTVDVRGAGSSWSVAHLLIVGSGGTGILRITDGGVVSAGGGDIGHASSGTATVVVTGPGSALNFTSSLHVGLVPNPDASCLTVADGGTVRASLLAVYYMETVNVRVSGNGMVVLGTPSTAGIVTGTGTIRFYADAFLAAGTYWPITESASRDLIWDPNGRFSSLGSTWSTASHSLTVPVATALNSGDVDSVTTGERLLVTDVSSGRRVGVSFDGVRAGTTLSARPMTPGELAGLPLEADESVLSAWYFATNFSSDKALVAMPIVGRYSDLSVWRYSGGAWAEYSATDLILDSNDIASFTVDDFSGYALVGVPEPAALTLLVVGCVAILRPKR